VNGALRADLVTWVEGDAGAAVTEASVIGKGSSRRTWGVRLDDGRVVVVREDTGAGPMAGTPLDLRREATVYRALTGRGLPVPALLGVAPDGTAVLLEHAPGTAELKTADPDEQAAAARDYLRQLGRLHGLDVAGLDLGPLVVPDDGPAHALVDVDLWRSIQAGVPERFSTPAGTFALDWLAAHPPPVATRTSLCHGDAGPLNFLYEDGAVTAMVDWEFAHVGDPVDDLAWVAVRNQVLRSGIDLPSVFAVWAETTGCDVDPGRLEYYRALVLVRMLVSCDATVRWTDGVETDDNRTQVLLRPYLARMVCEALRRAGCDDPELAAVTDEAQRWWSSSPLVPVFGAEPVLDELGALR
jgi:aminoglycoside phosphotransferase (APT) family kinase protein